VSTKIPHKSVGSDDDLHDRILKNPALVLEDPSIMRALISMADTGKGGNVVDLRTIALDRLEARLSRLEDIHRSVVAAAYENLAGMNQVHRAILRMLDPTGFEEFLRDLDGEVAAILRLDCVRLVLETALGGEDPAVRRLSDVLSVAEPGFVARYLDGGREVVLRRIAPDAGPVHRGRGAGIRSEAALRLDLGSNRLPGMLVLGSKDPHHFRPDHGTDLLAFFGAVFERAMMRWLS